MSGGALDYVCFRLDDPIKEIEKRIRDNGKTLQQIWDDMTEEEKKNAVEWGHDWEFPWDEKNVPDSVRSIAQDEAWKKCKSVGVGLAAKFKYKTLPTKEARDEWNKIYNDTLKMMIDSHNNGIEHKTYSPETIEAMKKMLDTIKRSKIYLQRIELLFSGDDGESDLIECTKEDLKKAGLSDECI
jgi:hypothetical protein